MQKLDLEGSRYLVADIGGTNTRVAIAHGRNVIADSIRRYKNVEAPSFKGLLCRYIAEHGALDFDGCCVAEAGPRQYAIWTCRGLVPPHELI